MKRLSILIVAFLLSTPIAAVPQQSLRPGIAQTQYALNKIEAALDDNQKDIAKLYNSSMRDFASEVGCKSCEWLGRYDTVSDSWNALQTGDYLQTIGNSAKMIADFWGALDPIGPGRVVKSGATIIEQAGNIYEVQGLLRQQQNLLKLRQDLELQLSRLQGANPRNLGDSWWNDVLRNDDLLQKAFRDWLQRSGASEQQVASKALKDAAKIGKNTPFQVASGMAAYQRSSGEHTSSLIKDIPGINPAVLAAMDRCDDIATTMLERQAKLNAILEMCPKPTTPGGRSPRCPEYEQAAVQNAAINRSSMTCNKDASGGYIPFFASDDVDSGEILAKGVSVRYERINNLAPATKQKGYVELNEPAFISKTHVTYNYAVYSSFTPSESNIHYDPGPVASAAVGPSERKVWGAVEFPVSKNTRAESKLLDPGDYFVLINYAEKLNRRYDPELVYSGIGFRPFRVTVKAGYVAKVSIPVGMVSFRAPGEPGTGVHCYTTDEHGYYTPLIDYAGQSDGLNILPPGAYSYLCGGTQSDRTWAAAPPQRGTFSIVPGKTTSVELVPSHRNR